MSIRDYFRKYRQRQHVRPWALLSPILILLLALPLLRPLRHSAVSPEESATLSAVEAMVEHQQSVLAQPLAPPEPTSPRPVYIFLLAGPYELIHYSGLRLSQNPILVSYLLTIIGVTFPAAMCAGLIYRMSRIFEIRRPLRTALGFSCVLATGVFSYATVLNPQVPAAFAILWSCACLIHVITIGRPDRATIWLAFSAFLASLAYVVEPAAGVFLLLLPLVIMALPWSLSLRIGGVLIYIMGALPPLVLHVMLLSPDPVRHLQNVIHDLPPQLLTTAQDTFEDETSPITQFFSDFIGSLFGSHGLLSHYPVMLFAFMGIAIVLHRHWPAPTKMLAIVTAVCSLLILILYSAQGTQSLFGPALLFWAGAWLRHRHRVVAYVTLYTFLVVSIIVSIIGATGYTPLQTIAGPWLSR